MSNLSSVGVRTHSGWAAAIAVAGPLEGPVAIRRRRIVMIDGAAGGIKQPYHAAAEADREDAERIITTCSRSAVRLATAGLRAMLEDLREAGYHTGGYALLLAAGRPLPELHKILASHALIHTAEGELFREALRAAGRQCALQTIEVKERELFDRACAQLGLREDRVREHLAQMGRGIGPPWQQDQKLAALAAWLALSPQPPKA